MPPGITDKDYVIAQYDYANAYMDAAIQSIFTAVDSLGLAENTIVGSTAITARRSTTTSATSLTIMDSKEPTLIVPLIIRYPGRLRRQGLIQPTQGPCPNPA